jgi:3-oxoacyl-[acyl-carrier protein] reductase
MGADAVLVTGGARGIGRAIVERLAAEGWSVAFTSRRDGAATREVEEATGGRARAYRLDLADPRRPSDLLREVEAVHGPLLALVNNAGTLREGLLAMTTDDEWQAVLDINLGGVFRVCRVAVPGMMSRRAGSIVNVASLSALRALPGQAAYAASKAGIMGLTRALAREAGRRGVRANVVLPGFVETELTASLAPEKRQLLRDSECLAAGVRTADVAHAVAFLVSPRAAAITGASLVVDAGASA